MEGRLSIDKMVIMISSDYELCMRRVTGSLLPELQVLGVEEHSNAQLDAIKFEDFFFFGSRPKVGAPIDYVNVLLDPVSHICSK